MHQMRTVTILLRMSVRKMRCGYQTRRPHLSQTITAGLGRVHSDHAEQHTGGRRCWLLTSLEPIQLKLVGAGFILSWHFLLDINDSCQMHYTRMQNIPDDEEIPAKALRTRTLE